MPKYSYVKPSTPAAAPSSTKASSTADEEAAAAVLTRAAQRQLSKKPFVPALTGKPLLDLDGSFERAGLLTALRLAFSSDVLTVVDLKALLCGPPVGMNHVAASSVVEQVYSAHGEAFTVEQLVAFLVPVRRVPHFDELVESEVSMLRTSFASVSSGASAISPGLLDKAVAQVPGLHPAGTLDAAAKADVIERMQSMNGESSTDLGDLFNIMREHQRATRETPTSQQLIRAFNAFDDDKSGTLTYERLKRLLVLFDGVPEAEIRRLALTECKATTAMVDKSERGSASSQRVDYRRLVHLYMDALQKAKLASAERGADAAKKAAHGGGGGGGGIFGGLFGGRKDDRGAAAKDAGSSSGGGLFGGLFGGKKASAADLPEPPLAPRGAAPGSGAAAAAAAAGDGAATSAPSQFL